MKKEKKFMLIVAVVCILIIIFLGTYSRMVSLDMNFYDALFSSIAMLLGDYGDSGEGPVILLTKYCAILFTVLILGGLLEKYLVKLRNGFISIFSKDSIFVYSSDDIFNEFDKNTNSKVIHSDDFLLAYKYLLLSDDESNMNFYNAHLSDLKDKEVYIKNNMLAGTVHGKHHFFSIEEIITREYWKEHALLEFKDKDILNISMVGFDKLGEEMLYESLNTNIFSPNQVVNYHIFGDTSDFKNEHINLDKLNVHCYEGSPLENIEILKDSDIIFAFGKKEEVYTMIGVLKGANIVYFAKDNLNSEFLSNHKFGKDVNNIKVYPMFDKIYSEDNILSDKRYEYAIKLNDYYGGATWDELDVFTRNSNISCVDHFEFTTVPMLESKYEKEFKDITDEEFESELPRLMELEHMRWMNFHLYCNWTHGEEKDKKMRIHQDLIPYGDLPPDEQIKDAKQMRALRGFVLEESEGKHICELRNLTSFLKNNSDKITRERGLYYIKLPKGKTYKNLLISAQYNIIRPISIEKLEKKCKDLQECDSDILYIGKANLGIRKDGLLRRIAQYNRTLFNQGKNHMGGRAIGQLDNFGDLELWIKVGFKDDNAVIQAETKEIVDFYNKYGSYPFANFKK